MRLNKQLQFAVSFAKFAKNYSIEPLNLGELIALANAAHSAGTTEANGGKRADTARRAFEECATREGFTVSWDGLYPSLEKDGSAIFLPS